MIILFQIILFLDVYNAEWSSKPISSYQVTIVLGLSSCLPDNISYDMSKFLIYLWKAKWSPVDFTWPVSVNLNAGIWLTLSTDRVNFVMSSHVLKIYYGISKLIFELSVRRTLNTVSGCQYFTKTGFFRLSTIDQN